MVKVKLRVPLSSAPRETSSPLANPNPLRSAPDYSEDEDDNASANNSVGTDRDGQDEDMDEDEEEDEDQEADELDELDELEEGEDDPLNKASSSTPTKRRSITLKPRSKSGDAGSSASPSIEGSASPGAKVLRRGNLARMAQVQAMTVEELDALPAAKRRKTAKARGAAGPGRGWRKGLTKGQKPVYELPSAETTPTTFGNTSNARSATPSTAVKAETTPTPAPTLPRPKSTSAQANAGESSKSSTPLAVRGPGHAVGGSSASNVAASSIKIVSGPGGHTFTGDLSAKAGTAKNPGFRYPPLPSSRAGPPVQPLARIPTSFQSVIPLERNGRQPRRWVKAKREILSIGGRPWSIPVFYGGEDRGYEKKVDATLAATGTAPVGGGGSGGGEKVASKAGTPAASSATAGTGAAAKAASPTPTPTPTASLVTQSSTTAKVGTPTSTTAAATGGGGGSPLPPPKHLGGLANQAAANWRGQSPAFLFGGR